MRKAKPKPRLLWLVGGKGRKRRAYSCRTQPGDDEEGGEVIAFGWYEAMPYSPEAWGDSRDVGINFRKSANEEPQFDFTMKIFEVDEDEEISVGMSRLQLMKLHTHIGNVLNQP